MMEGDRDWWGMGDLPEGLTEQLRLFVQENVIHALDDMFAQMWIRMESVQDKNGEWRLGVYVFGGEPPQFLVDENPESPDRWLKKSTLLDLLTPGDLTAEDYDSDSLLEYAREARQFAEDLERIVADRQGDTR